MAGDRMTKPPARCDSKLGTHEFELSADLCQCTQKRQIHSGVGRWTVEDNIDPNAITQRIDERELDIDREAKDKAILDALTRLAEFDNEFGSGITASVLRMRVTRVEKQLSDLRAQLLALSKHPTGEIAKVD